MKILHISDIHFRREYLAGTTDYLSMLQQMRSPLDALKECLLDVCAKHRLDYVLISGDLTEDGEVDDYRFLKEWLVDVLGDTPIFVTLGNHDIKENFLVGWCNQEKSTAFYNQRIELEDMTFISFDNSAYGHPNGIVSAEQFDWLEKELLQIGTKQPILLMTHHHLLSIQSSMPKWAGADRLLHVLSTYNIRSILTGHTHHPFVGEIQGIPYYTAAGMSFIGEDEGAGIVRFEEAYGYNVYRFNGERLVEQTARNVKPGKVLTVIQM